MKVLDLFSLKGKTALVTGGSRGLGLQMAEALGEMGARVAITARKKDELEEAVGAGGGRTALLVLPATAQQEEQEAGKQGQEEEADDDADDQAAATAAVLLLRRGKLLGLLEVLLG